MKKVSALSLVFFSAFLFSCREKKTVTPPEPQASLAPIAEGFPSSYVIAFEEQQKELEKATSNISFGLQDVVSLSRTWPPGSVVTVAFKDGSTQLRTQITQAIKPWTDSANVQFDFGNASSGFRTWSLTDSTYAADIRITFDRGASGGYWSCVGRDSINTNTCKPNAASMNFEGFDQGLPAEWQGIVLHEFGHALGFLHEHQSPEATCEQEYRWEDDPGYVRTQDMFHQFIPDSQGRKPGIYTTLGGPPNRWDRATVDFNLKQFANTSELGVGNFDKDSIMKYRFVPNWYLNISTSTTSGCFTPASSTLSSQDRNAAARRYPHNPAEVTHISAERTKVSKRMLKVKDLSEGLRQYFQTMIVKKKASDH